MPGQPPEGAQAAPSGGVLDRLRRPAELVEGTRKLGMRTVAEGVERVAEEEFLRAAGADCVQGFLHLRPTPPAEFSAWLDAHVADVREADRRAGITRLAGRRSG